MDRENRFDRRCILALSAAIITIAVTYLVRHDQTFVHIDAIAHVNKARGLWDNTTPGLRQLGSIWLPLQHFLILPFTFVNVLWTTGLAGSIVSAACFAGTSIFLYGSAARWTGSRAAGWIAFLLFALNPRIIYLFTTPMTEPLMVMCASGLVYYLVRWIETDAWSDFAMACLMVFAGTLTRYEGWAIAAAAIPLVSIVAKQRRVQSTILFTGAAAFGPMLWMLYNMTYFDDPLMFAYGRGSARDYAQEYFYRTGKLFATAGQAWDSFLAYSIDVAYCLSPGVLWLALGGVVLAVITRHTTGWRKPLVIGSLAVGPFLFYCYNLYANMIPVLMPGLVKDEPDSIYNVRYGTVMAATLPILAAFTLFIIFTYAERRRVFVLGLVPLIFAPNPIPEASEESAVFQLTDNLFYKEGIHNQSFWMPPFVEIAHKLQAEIATFDDNESFILTNSRIVHPTVWATGIPMRRFINEMNKDRYDNSLGWIVPEVRWVITEEGDQLWHAQGRILQRDWVEVAAAKTPSTGTVRLYRRLR